VRTAVALCVALVLAGCGSEDADDGSASANGLQATREDGSRIAFPGDVRAWCGRFDDLGAGEKNNPRQALHVVGGELPGDDEDDPTSFWLYSQRLDSLAQDARVDLAKAPEDRAVMFVLDADTENELATNVEDTAGTVDVAEWGCEQGDAVRLVFDGTLGSEFGDAPSVTIGGEVEAEIGEAPKLPE
jgi:hypothetical protein